MQESFLTFLGDNLQTFLTYTGVYNATPGHLVMILIGLLFIFLAIKYEFEPMLLIPIGFGILIGNIPFKDAGLQVGIYEEGSVLNILYQGVTSGWYPPLIFLGIGAMTDFSALISNPKLMLIGAAAQFGIFGAYIIALQMGFEPNQAGAIGIIGGADGPTAIFLSSKLAPNLMGAIAVSAYSYMALVPIIQPPFMRLLTTQKERLIYAGEQVKETFLKVFPYIIAGVGIGAFIHNWIPQSWVEASLGNNNPFSVVLATLIGVPMYADIFGTIPVAEALYAKGAQLGTILSFMMAVTTLSLPSIIMLRKAVKPKLLALFVGICTVGIISVGYLFNTLQPLFI